MFLPVYELLKELVQYERDFEPNSESLCKAEMACDLAGRSAHRQQAAEDLLKDALAIDQRAHGTESATAAEIGASLYWVYTDMGQFSKAVRARRECIRIGGHDLISENESSVTWIDHNS